MSTRYSNPFQAIDISVPLDYHEAFERYSQRSANADPDDSPFPRMVDLWFLAVCIAARLGLEPVDTSKHETKKIIDGSIFASDPWRVEMLMLIAIGRTDDVTTVSEPRKVMALASGLAAAGLPRVLEMLTEGEAPSIWNLSDAIDTVLGTKEGV